MGNRRTEARNCVRLSVVLHAKGNRLIPARTRDVSSGGMFIETDAQGLSRNALARIGFVFEQCLCIAHARVIRKTADGIGIRLSESAHEARRALAALAATGAPIPYCSDTVPADAPGATSVTASTSFPTRADSPRPPGKMPATS